MLSGLRARIVLFTVPPLVTLTVASLWMVDRNVSEQAHRRIHDELRRSAAVFENMLDARASALAAEGAVIVRDPKFFSVLGIPGGANDPQYRSTVQGVAQDFNRITQSDVFEVLDARGRLLASVGRAASSDSSRTTLVREAGLHDGAAGLLVEPDGHYQAVVTPVVADGRIVGSLLLGESVGGALAQQLRTLTHTEVTFFADGRTTGTTLEREGDQHSATEAAREFAGSARNAPAVALSERAGDETRWLTLAGRIPGGGGGRHLYVLQRSLDVETAFLRPMRTGLVVLGLLAALGVLLAGLAIAQGITSPIARLVHASEAMEHGQYDYPVEVTSRDEVGTLARRFELMRSRQREVVESLQETARVRREFISVASHELRTPISVIQGFHELFRDGTLGAVTDGQRRALEAIERAVRTLSRIAADATRMAQIEERELQLELADVGLAALLERVVREAVESARGRQVRVECAPPDGSDATVHADGPRLADAIANLVRNGIRFTPDGGLVSVRAWRAGGSCFIEVRDSGVGIAPERLRQLLERQVPVRDSRNHHSSNDLEFNSAGLGLGLSIARGLIEAHGGRLHAESHEGRGSVFTIQLPQPDDTQARAAA